MTVSPLLRIPWLWRLLLFCLGAGLVVLLIVAATLEPDPQGFGTHQQLGLPPCSFVTMFQLRCPSCGMTTSWAHLMRGRLWMAWRTNAGGTLLGLIALAAGPWALWCSIRGYWLGQPTEWQLLIGGLVVIGVTLADWCVRLLLVYGS